jgi:hypothetical protein
VKKQSVERTRGRKRDQKQAQIQLTEQRREGMEELGTWDESALRAGACAPGGDLGYDDEADGDTRMVDGEDGDAAGSAADFIPPEEPDHEEQPRTVTLADLLGSRLPVVLLRLDCAGEEVTVRTCAGALSREAREALGLLEQFVTRCFNQGRANLEPQEWDGLLGRAPAPLTRRLTLLLRLAVKANEKVPLGEDTGAAFTPHDIGLERFAGKFAALPDGTPFSIRLLLLDQRGRERGNNFFDQLPDGSGSSPCAGRWSGKTGSRSATTISAPPSRSHWKNCSAPPSPGRRRTRSAAGYATTSSGGGSRTSSPTSATSSVPTTSSRPSPLPARSAPDGHLTRRRARLGGEAPGRAGSG